MTKKIIAVLICSTSLLGCQAKPFTGYVVCKEYTAGHMDNEEAKVTQEAGFILPAWHVVVHRPTPKWVESKWCIYVANKRMIKSFDVDSLDFIRYRLGQKVTLKTTQI